MLPAILLQVLHALGAQHHGRCFDTMFVVVDSALVLTATVIALGGDTNTLAALSHRVLSKYSPRVSYGDCGSMLPILS